MSVHGAQVSLPALPCNAFIDASSVVILAGSDNPYSSASLLTLGKVL